MARRFSILALCWAAALPASCAKEGDEAIHVALIGSSEGMFARGVRLPDAGQSLRAATAGGLVGFDAEGQVVPALAERWIITDDGRSYLFRLAERNWPDGSPLSSESVKEALNSTLKGLRGTSLGLDLATISQVRAMAGRVVEIRLATPMPELLQLLAQPELALFRKGRSSGEMTLQRQDLVAILTPVSPELRGLPSQPDWGQRTRPLRVTALPAATAVALFSAGELDVVLGGRIETLPLAVTGPLSRGTVRLDPVPGLLGLQVSAASGFLDDPMRREALALAIDRETMVAKFNADGWVATARIVTQGMAGDQGSSGERWPGLSQAQRRREAVRRVAAWRKSSGRGANGGGNIQLTIAMPEGTGADIVFARLRADLAAIGISAKRKGAGQPADLVWIDRVARVADVRWFLNQFNCTLRQGLCSPRADALVAEAMRAPDGAGLLAKAEAELTAANLFIPIGTPLRWSMVRSNINGFAQNRLGVHPLYPLTVSPK